MEGTVDEVEERALPFARGDEVLVHIVEPHMYNEDDAVAKIDGYIISVAGGGGHVGEKRLVRIEEVGRTSAGAVSRGLPSADGGDDEPLQSSSSAPGPQRRTAPVRATAEAASSMEPLRDRQDRRQAVPRRGGPVPPRRAAAGDEGAKVALEPLLYRGDDEIDVAMDDLAKVKVEAKVVGHERGPKLRVFKFKPKRGYKKRTGHRQELTRIEITGIAQAGAARRAAAAKTSEEATDNGA